MAIKAKIQFLTGDQKGKVVNVEKLPLIIGRTEGCDLLLTGDHQVSRRHAEIHANGASVIITDLGSSLGTLVNQKKIGGEQPLRSGDVIVVGKYQLRIALPVPSPAAKAAAATSKAPEDQEGTAFVDMEKLVGGGEQEGTGFVDMDKMVSTGPAAQDGTAAVDMSTIVNKKTLGERWKGLPRPRKILFGAAGAVVVVCLLAGTVAALWPKEKPPVLEEGVSIKVGDKPYKMSIPKAREIASDNEEVCIARLDESNDSFALLDGIEEGDGPVNVTVLTWDKERHVYPVTVVGYADPFSGLTDATKFDNGKQKLIEGDQKVKEAEKDVGQLYAAYHAYHLAWLYLNGDKFAPPEMVADAKAKAKGQKDKLDEAAKKYQLEFDRARKMEQWDSAILALQSLLRIYPDKEDPKHQGLMQKLRIMQEKKAGHL